MAEAFLVPFELKEAMARAAERREGARAAADAAARAGLLVASARARKDEERWGATLRNFMGEFVNRVSGEGSRMSVDGEGYEIGGGGGR